MADTAILALISGLSGVGGAIVGAGASILADRRTEKAQRRRDHDDALVAYWEAVNSYGHLWGSFAKVLPPAKNFLEEALQGLRISGYGAQLVARQFTVADAYWRASGRLRSVATAAELDVVNSVESVISEWEIGSPMPEEFGVQLRRLRALVEKVEPLR
jgi:hypothetical protein